MSRGAVSIAVALLLPLLWAGAANGEAQQLRGSRVLIVAEEPLHAKSSDNGDAWVAKADADSAVGPAAEEKSGHEHCRRALRLLAGPFRGAWQTLVQVEARLLRQRPQHLEPHIVINSEEPEVSSTQKFAELCGYAIGIVVWVAVASYIAHYYVSHKDVPGLEVARPADAEEAFKEWKFGVFECFNRLDVSLWVCFCPAVRWADNVSSMGVLGFWLAFSLFLGLTIMNAETQDAWAWLMLSVMGAGFRQEFRQKFNMARQGGITYVEDCLLYCFCSCCVITQEARHIEEAVKVGHKATVKAEK